MFDTGSLPGLSRVTFAKPPTYAALYEIYIQSVNPTHQKTVREIIASALGRKIPGGDSNRETNNLMPALQRLHKALTALYRVL